MQYLIYLVYPAMLIALLWGAKISKKGEWNEEAFSRNQMKVIQGYMALCIMFHHLGQKTCADWIPHQYIVPGLEFFVPIGYFFVAVFLFCSGYGLYKSHLVREDYPAKGFIRHRIVPLVIIFYITDWIYLFFRFIVHEKFKPLQVLWYATGLQLGNPYGWYAVVIPIFYLCFYLAFRYCKNDRAALAVVSIFTLCYITLGTFIDHNDWWMRGQWWYNCIALFPFGMFFAKSEEKITAFLKKGYVLKLILTAVLMYVFYILSLITQDIFTYYGETFDAPDTVFRRWMCLIPETLTSLLFVLLVFMIVMKIKIDNRFLEFMGSITFEFYLIHGLAIELFGYDFDGDAKPLYYIKSNVLLTVISLVSGIVLAYLLHKLYVVLAGRRKKDGGTSDKPQAEASAG